MAHAKLLNETDILEKGVQMVESEGLDTLSLRAVAEALGVKAPSLYRYFRSKEALELAVAEETVRRMHLELGSALSQPNPVAQLIAFAAAYRRFAEEHGPLYSFMMQRLKDNYGSPAGKALWKLLLAVLEGLSGKPDDTSGAVALWAFLHGYVVLERAGGFGESGPHLGFGVGLDAFMHWFQHRP